MTSSSGNDLAIKIAYFTSLAGASILLGFNLTLGKLRKSQPNNPDAILYEEGAALARKALMRGTIYSVCGFSLFAVASYTLFGKDMIRKFNSRAQNNDEKDIEYLQSLLGASKSELLGNKNLKTEINKPDEPETQAT